MSHYKNQQAIHGIALTLAPSLRDKFDFSVDTQFADWAKLSIKAAHAFSVEMQPLIDAAVKKDADELAKAQAAQQAAAKPLEVVPDTPKTEVTT